MTQALIVMVLRTIAQIVLALLQGQKLITADQVATFSAAAETFWPAMAIVILFIWQTVTNWNTEHVVSEPKKVQRKSGRLINMVRHVSPITGRTYYKMPE